jgi:hypothetical protein
LSEARNEYLQTLGQVHMQHLGLLLDAVLRLFLCPTLSSIPLMLGNAEVFVQRPYSLPFGSSGRYVEV